MTKVWEPEALQQPYLGLSRACECESWTVKEGDLSMDSLKIPMPYSSRSKSRFWILERLAIVAYMLTL